MVEHGCGASSPVITRANNSKLPTTTTALDQSEPSQTFKCISDKQNSPSWLGHSKQQALESDDVAVKAALFDEVDLLHGSARADVHRALRMGSSSSWEISVQRKELNMKVVSRGGGLFTGDR